MVFDIRTLHCLRHTFAVRRYLETRDIYLVKTELGHASVVMTEKYANFDVRKLEEDFPSIVDEKHPNIPTVSIPINSLLFTYCPEIRGFINV